MLSSARSSVTVPRRHPAIANSHRGRNRRGATICRISKGRSAAKDLVCEAKAVRQAGRDFGSHLTARSRKEQEMFRGTEQSLSINDDFHNRSPKIAARGHREGWFRPRGSVAPQRPSRRTKRARILLMTAGLTVVSDSFSDGSWYFSATPIGEVGSAGNLPASVC